MEPGIRPRPSVWCPVDDVLGAGDRGGLRRCQEGDEIRHLLRLCRPTAPYRILELGGNEVAAGMFLGFLTYASAVSAPITGSLADRFGKQGAI